MEEDDLLDKDSGKVQYSNNRKAILGIVFLSIYHDDCDDPIRVWLGGVVISFGFHTIFLLSTELLSASFKEKPGVVSIYYAVNTIFQSFLFLWMLVGAVWAFNDDDQCRKDFSEGWWLTVSILGTYFGVLSLVLLALFGIVVITCLGSWRISSYMTKAS